MKSESRRSALAVIAVVLSLSLPAGAQPAHRERSPAERIVKALKHWIHTIFEDRMSEPKP